MSGVPPAPRGSVVRAVEQLGKAGALLPTAAQGAETGTALEALCALDVFYGSIK